MHLKRTQAKSSPDFSRGGKLRVARPLPLPCHTAGQRPEGLDLTPGSLSWPGEGRPALYPHPRN